MTAATAERAVIGPKKKPHSRGPRRPAGREKAPRCGVVVCVMKGYYERTALRRNPAGWLIEGAFRYTVQFEEQRLDEDSGMAGLPGVSERDRRTGQDAETMGAAEVWQVDLLRVRPERARDRRSL